MVEQAEEGQYDDYEEQKTFIEEPAILDKFKAAGVIADAALEKAIELAVPGADIATICATCDTFIEEEVKKTFSNKKSKNMERGIAFPTCLSVNNIMGHFSPLVDESERLQEGDLVKIMLGAHFDGYSSNVGHTIVVGDGPVEGRKADAVLAAWNAFQAAQRRIAEAASNNSVTEVIQKIAEEFECNAVEGVLSHKVKRHLIDGNDVIINKETPTQQVQSWDFAPGDVIGLDVYVSTGQGKPREHETRCTVFKRELEMVYNLKMKSARAFFVEVNRRFPTLPFSIRAMQDQTAAKVGVKECMNHNMLVPYPVLAEKQGEFVAQFKATVVVQPRSTAVIAGNKQLDTSRFQTDKSVQNADLQGVLAQPLWKKEKVKKNQAA